MSQRQTSLSRNSREVPHKLKSWVYRHTPRLVAAGSHHGEGIPLQAGVAMNQWMHTLRDTDGYSAVASMRSVHTGSDKRWLYQVEWRPRTRRGGGGGSAPLLDHANIRLSWPLAVRDGTKRARQGGAVPWNRAIPPPQQPPPRLSTLYTDSGRVLSYALYVSRLLKVVKPESGFTSGGKARVDQLVRATVEQLIEDSQAIRRRSRDGRTTVSDEDVLQAARQRWRKTDLWRRAESSVRHAVVRYRSSTVRKDYTRREVHAGLYFPVSRVASHLKLFLPRHTRLGATVAVTLAALMETVLSRLLLLAATRAHRDQRRARITAADVDAVIRQFHDLRAAFSLSTGGGHRRSPRLH